MVYFNAYQSYKNFNIWNNFYKYNNFKYSFYNVDINNELNKILSLGHGRMGETHWMIIFDSEEDLLAFILKYS